MKVKTPSEVSVNRALNTLLEGIYMPATLSCGKGYGRVQDDCEGIMDYSQSLSVGIAHDSDVWVNVGGNSSLRFRVPFIGGGVSSRVRNGLLVLAEAIRRDNEECPQFGTMPMENDYTQYRKATVKLLISSIDKEDDLPRSIEVDTGLHPKDFPDQEYRKSVIESYFRFYSDLWKTDQISVGFTCDF